MRIDPLDIYFVVVFLFSLLGLLNEFTRGIMMCQAVPVAWHKLLERVLRGVMYALMNTISLAMLILLHTA